MSRRRPGNGSATLLDMLSNLFYFSPPPTTPSAVDGERAATRRVANAERRTETEREREGERGRERSGRTRWERTATLHLLPSPPPPPPLSLSFHRVTLRAHTSTPFSNIASSVPSLLLLLFCWPPLAFSCLPPLFSLASRESGWNRESLATRREEKERERETRNEKKERERERGVATVVTLGSAICDWEKEEEKEKGKERDGKGGGKRRTWEARGR